MFRRATYLFLVTCSLFVGCASQQATGVGPTISPHAIRGETSTVEESAPATSPDEEKNLIKVAEEIDVEAPIEQVWAVFDDPESYWKILPLVKDVKARGKAPDGALLVELTQGIAFVTGTYTARILKLRPYEIELLIDHQFPSVLRDGRGIVELKSINANQTHVVYRVVADIGDGWALHLLKGRIRNALAQPPSLLKKFVEKK